MHLKISVHNTIAMAILLAHLLPVEYKMLWPDIAVKNNPKSGWHGRERHESMVRELRHCGKRHTSSTRVFPSLFLCAPLCALWCRLIKTSLTRSSKEDLVPVCYLSPSSVDSSSGDKQKPGSVLNRETV